MHIHGFLLLPLASNAPSCSESVEATWPFMQIGDSGACIAVAVTKSTAFEKGFSFAAMNPITGNIACQQLYLEILGPVATKAPIAFVTKRTRHDAVF
jgi:hypothetical protein